MSVAHWLAFAAASAMLLAIPGPTVLMVIAHALGHGRRSAGATVAGVALGDFAAMTASMLGLGALLAASAIIFTVLKWIGAVYLITLGVKLWRAPPAAALSQRGASDAGEERSRRMFLHAFAVTALNPKSIVFFVAFVPQFLDASRALFPQMAILEATFLTLAAANAATYALAASAARRTIGDPRAQRIVNRTGGSLLIGAGLLAAGWKNAA